VKRRDFIAVLSGAAAAWPFAARAQQAAMPVIGFLHRETPAPWWEGLIAVMKRSLAEMDYVEGRNFVIEYRWAEGQTDRLPALAADLVRRKVAVIVAPGNTPTALAAKAATKTIPIVFSVGTDPVESGLVESLNRPGGNVTGISVIDIEMIAKRVQLLHQLVPTATSIALLVNPRNPITAQAETREVQIAANALGLRMLVLNASNRDDIAIAFTKLLQEQASALVVSHEVFFSTVHDQLIELAMRHKIPMSTHSSGVPKGALVAYGHDPRDIWRHIGIYVGRLLKGEGPADLPVQRSVKLDLIINLKTAKALGIGVPPALLVRADEVIE
jgi:ABC-type uncharacterized transport system substrate-binding protein